VEFTDYQCPFCKRHITRVFPQIKKDYVDTGKVKYVLREFPLKSIHPNAPKASAAALCANDQGKYWEMHDKIFESPRKLAPADLKGHAEALGMDIAAFEGCIKDDTHGKRIAADVQAGSKAGVRGTPSFFFGKTGAADAKKIRATKFLRGAQGYPQFKKVIDGLLASAKTGGAPTKAAAQGQKTLTKEDYKKMGIQ
jgi:protein-disulfide isomerase